MYDHQFLDEVAFLDAFNNEVEKKTEEYLNPKRFLEILKVDYKNLENLQDQRANFARELLYYNSLAARLINIRYKYTETIFEPCMAHYRKYASLYLKCFKPILIFLFGFGGKT